MSLIIRNIINFTLPEYLIIIFFSLLSSFLVITRSIPDILFLLPFLSLSFAMFGLNMMNNIIDVNIDRINKPLRPLPSGKISMKQAKLLVSFSILLSLLFAYFINLFSLIIIIIFNLLSFIYSVPPIRLKRFILSDNIIGSIIYGVFPLLIVWSMFSEAFPLIFLIIFPGLIFSVVSIKDIEDVVGEKKYKLSSLPIKIGIKRTSLVSIILILLLLIFALTLSIFGIMEIMYLYATVLSFIVFIIYGSILVKGVKKIEKNIIRQSNLMTISMIFVAIVELFYGIFSLL